MTWTDERIALLTRLWIDGKSAAEIAPLIGPGISRNSVIAKVHRLKLNSHSRMAPPPPVKKAPKPKPRTVNGGLRPPLAFDEVAMQNRIEAMGQYTDADMGRPRVLAAQADVRRCRWPIGDPRCDDFGYCNAWRDVMAFGAPYCEEHRALALDQKAMQRNALPDLERMIKNVDRTSTRKADGS